MVIAGQLRVSKLRTMELVVEATSVDSPTGQPECDKIQSLEEKVAENPKPSGKKARKLKRLRNEPPVFIGK